jgi:hypothetical protein
VRSYRRMGLKKLRLVSTPVECGVVWPAATYGRQFAPAVVPHIHMYIGRIWLPWSHRTGRICAVGPMAESLCIIDRRPTLSRFSVCSFLCFTSGGWPAYFLATSSEVQTCSNELVSRLISVLNSGFECFTKSDLVQLRDSSFSHGSFSRVFPPRLAHSRSDSNADCRTFTSISVELGGRLFRFRIVAAY